MNTKLVGAISRLSILPLLLLIPLSTANGGTLSRTFENKTGKDAYDLHIKYNRPAKIVSQDPEVFDKVDDGAKEGKNIIDLSGGTLADGKSVKVKADAMTGDLEINEWWWTDKDHKRLGEDHTGCSASDGCSAESEVFDTASLSGVVVVEMKTDRGPIRLNLPVDHRPGDTVSGLVEDERKGATGELSGAVIEINGQQHQLRNGMLTFVVPSTGMIYPFILKNSAGHEIARGQLPRGFTAFVPPQAGTPNFTLPTIGQGGRPVKIGGPFNGTAANTSLTIGGQPATVLAVSPQNLIFKSPLEPIGTTNISLTNGGSPQSGPYRNVGIRLSSPKTNLIRGEKTTVKLTASGLSGIEENVPLYIMTTGSVSMDGGNNQHIEISRQMINTAGEFIRSFDITGIMPGVFNVVASIIAGNPPVAQDSKCKCKCEFAKTPIVSAGTKQIEGGTQYSFAPNMKVADCTGNRCSVSKIDYSWSIAAASTATYSVVGGKASKELTVDVTGKGTLELTVTVTVTCSDGTTCTATASQTITVKP